MRRKIKQWINNITIPLLDLVISVKDVCSLIGILLVTYLFIFYPVPMETNIEVSVGVLTALILLIALPNAIDAIWRLWRFLRTMGEFEMEKT